MFLFRPFLMFGLVASVWAQVSSGGDTVGLATLITQIGLSAVFLWQWQAERNLRIKRDEQLFTILEKQGPVLSEAIQALKDVQHSQQNLASIMPKISDWEQALRQLKDSNIDSWERRRRAE
jgi:hypothetical protein